MVAAVLFMGGMSMVVWAHHMFLTGMGTTLSSVLPGHDDDHFGPVGDPDHVAGADAVGRVDPLHHADAVRARVPADVRHRRPDRPAARPRRRATSRCTTPTTSSAHFHYLVAPGTVFALFAGIYHWFPKITGRALDERLGKIHFWGSFVCMNAIFLPMFAMGLMGVNRRLYDAGAQLRARAADAAVADAHDVCGVRARRVPAPLRLEPVRELEGVRSRKSHFGSGGTGATVQPVGRQDPGMDRSSGPDHPKQ